MGDLPTNLPVTLATDWWMLGLQLFIAILSFGGTLLGVFLGIKLSMKNFYSQKWWEKKADAYLFCDAYLLELLENFLQFSNAAKDYMDQGKMADSKVLVSHFDMLEEASGDISTYFVKYNLLLSKKATSILKEMADIVLGPISSMDGKLTGIEKKDLQMLVENLEVAYTGILNVRSGLQIEAKRDLMIKLTPD